MTWVEQRLKNMLDAGSAYLFFVPEIYIEKVSYSKLVTPTSGIEIFAVQRLKGNEVGLLFSEANAE